MSNLKELYNGLSHEDLINSFEFTNRLQNNIIEKQKTKIESQQKEIELLNQDVDNLRKSIKLNLKND